MNPTTPNIAAVVVARQTSSRLPGKALTPVAGKPVLAHIIERLKACQGLSSIVVATSTNDADGEIAALAKTCHVDCYRGEPDDVLARICHASASTSAEAIIEVGGDCPLVGPRLISQGIQAYLSSKADVVTNALIPPFTYPVGYDFILVRRAALEEANVKALLKSERYQPFQYLIKNRHRFRFETFELAKNYSHWRWTLDYPEDLAFMKAVFEKLYATHPLFEFEEIHALLEKEPEIARLNAVHSSPTQVSTAWYTGSYSREVATDVGELLIQAIDGENSRHWEQSIEKYDQALSLVNELLERAHHFRKEVPGA